MAKIKDHITVDGAELPIHFGIKTVAEVAERYGKDLDEFISDVYEQAKKVMDDKSPEFRFSNIAKTTKLTVLASTVALNEGARRADKENRYTEDNVTDLIDDNPELLTTLTSKFLGSILPKGNDFTTGQKSPKNPKPKGEGKK